MIIPFQNIKNARDLGGLVTAEGKTVKHGLLLRSGELFHADDNDILVLSNDYRLKTVIDLRDKSEYESRPNKTVPGTVYHQIPILSSPSDAVRGELMRLLDDDPKKAFLLVYRDLAENPAVAAAYRKFFEIILKNTDSPLLYHCKQGKDRTGIASILLLTALGVAAEEIRRDYFLTNELLRADFKALENQGLPAEQLRKAEFTMFVMEDCLDQYLGLVGENWGGVEGYLKDGVGLDKTETASLRDAYTE